MEEWRSHIRSGVVGVLAMCIVNIGMVIWWAAKLDSITVTAVTRAELAIRDERIKAATAAIQANKQEVQRNNDKLDRILELLQSKQ